MIFLTIEYQARTVRKTIPTLTRGGVLGEDTILDQLAVLARSPKVMRLTAEWCKHTLKWDRKLIEWNERVGAEHAKLRQDILALRPSWSPAKLVARQAGDRAPHVRRRRPLRDPRRVPQG